MNRKTFLRLATLTLGLGALALAPFAAQAQSQHDGSAARPLRGS